MKIPIITLLSDFGLRDAYVAQMKAVILSVCPDATIVDISHEIRKFNVKMGAFILAQAAQYFAEGTVHVAVVDPGVGTERRPIIIETDRSRYVGPDNGLLMLSAVKEGIGHIYKIANPKYMLKTVSRTFHGRDVFSPAAAYLANGVPVSEFGPEVVDPVIPQYAKPRIGENQISGEVLHIDDFGNVITNVSISDLKRLPIDEGEELKIKFKDNIIRTRFCLAYGEVLLGAPLCIIGSSGFLELAINQGNATQTYGIKVGDLLEIKAVGN